MDNPFSYKIFFATPILWLGFVLAISFMEAWLKFRAEGVTKIIGLSIGKLVFGALNKVELFFLLVLLVIISFFRLWEDMANLQKLAIITLSAILLFQTTYLLPRLNSRIDEIRSDQSPKKSWDHIHYIGLEVFKVVLLALFVDASYSMLRYSL